MLQMVSTSVETVTYGSSNDRICLVRRRDRGVPLGHWGRTFTVTSVNKLLM